MARNPLIISTLAGLLIKITGLTLPAWAIETTARIGQAALPMGLLAVGAGLKLAGLMASPMLASALLSIRHVVLPLIGPSVVGVGMFGFTLSWDEIARTSQAIGDVNTLPLELQGLTATVTTPAIYALGTVTTVVSFAVMGITVGLALWLKKK